MQRMLAWCQNSGVKERCGFVFYALPASLSRAPRITLAVLPQDYHKLGKWTKEGTSWTCNIV